MKKDTNKDKVGVLVFSLEGEPLVPTKNYGKVRCLLKAGLARKVSREPFAIQLEYETSNRTRPYTPEEQDIYDQVLEEYRAGGTRLKRLPVSRSQELR